MTRIQFSCLIAVLAAIVSLSSPAQAQIAGQTYASPTAPGNTTCSPTAPCLLSRAISTAPAGGIVSCIDGGAFQNSTGISTSITIDCPGGVLTGSGPFIMGGAVPPAFTFTGTSSQVVTLRNLTFDGGGQEGAPFIRVTGGATLIIENCRFQNIANNNAIAVQFLPNSPAAQLIIRDSVFANNGIGPSSGGGLQVAPLAGGSASVVLEHVSFNLNVTGMVLSGNVNATMVNSMVSASRSNGILVGPGATLDIKDSTLAYNVGAAVTVATGGTVRLSNDDVKSNQIGIKNSGGQALFYKNNRILGNGSTATLASIQGGQ